MSLIWEDDAKEALQRAGFEVVGRDGKDDWCRRTYRSLLAADGKGKWAVLSWSYGSCSGCDYYIDMSDSERKAAFDSEIEIFDSEEKARLIFSDRKGW